MASDSLSRLCGSTFWNVSVTWDTDNPDFTPCFEKTVLIWTPCVFLWIFSPLEAYYIAKSRCRNIPYNWFNISKMVLNILLILLSISDLIYTIYAFTSSKDYAHEVDIYSPIVKGVSFLLCFTILYYNRVRGICSSGLLFLFWFILAIGGIAQLRTEISNVMTWGSPTPFYPFASYIVYYFIVVLLLLFNFFADEKPKFSEHPIPDKPCPETYSSFPSKLMFSWFDSLAWLGFRKPLETNDLWKMNYEDTAAGVVPEFDKHWNRYVEKSKVTTNWVPGQQQKDGTSYLKRGDSVEFIGENGVRRTSLSKRQQGRKPMSILPVLCKAFGGTFVFGALLKLGQDLLSFVSPQILRLLITFVESDESMWRGYFYALLLLLTATLQTLLLSQYFNRMFLVGLRVRTALTSAIYRKAMVMSNSARKESTVGEIVNLMSVDAQRFMDLLTYLNMIWSAPIQIVLALFFLWEILGPSVLAGLAVMIIMIPVNGLIANRVKKLQITQMKYKDERVKLMNEVLSGIKVLKLYAWEPSFEQQILRIRNKEIHVLKQAAYFNASTSFIWACAPFLVSLVTFGVFVLSNENNILDSKTAFVSLSLFNILRFPLSMLPMLITNMVQASVSIKRINKFMNEEELDPDSVTHDEQEADPLVIENGIFSWGGPSDDAIVLKNINVRIKEGSLVAVVGPVGSGKSSFISAFLGEMEKITGRVNTKGSLAYVPQQAWIQNATLQDNILFGKEMDNSTYRRVIDSCALKQDFDMLPAGDQTEIGEKGINLSGGQKQRVSLARAVYNNAQVYFLDDPLSAVDSHVGKHIFEKVVGPSGMLRNKTRVLVTHSITYLPEVDQILVLNGGQISEQGTYRELLNRKGAFAEFLTQHLQEIDYDEEEIPILDELKQQLIGSNIDNSLKKQMSRQRSSDSSSSNTSLQSRQKSVEPAGPKLNSDKLIEAEKAETGGVKWLVYKHYLLSIGIFLSVATLVLNSIFQGFSIGSNLWLSAWSSDTGLVNHTTNGTVIVNTHKRNIYLGVYAGLGVGQVLTVLLGTLAIFIGTLNAATSLHHHLMGNILRVPMTFFDVTPSGRILNRFSKDVDTLDSVLPMVIRGWLTCLLSVLSTLVVISYTTPVFISIILPIGAIYYFIQRFYVASSRQLKRLESISRSPIYSHFGETVTGVPVIRAYNVQKRFVLESEQKVDLNQVCYYPSLIANRWLAIRLETVGNMIIFFSALFAVLSRGEGSMNSGLVGLSVTYALQITQTLNWLVRMTSDVETNIVAVERIKEYGETTQEAAWEVTPNLVTEEWPDKGDVEFRDYKLRYREGLGLVLKGITFSVKGGEKVGIVGRTGAGKSSLTLGLFRILEAAGGAILIDGIDISCLGLHVLRSRLTIIPQDPVLFSGTLRMNLDPFGKYSDDAVWRALELAHLKVFVKGLTAGLQHEVSEGGDNLSVGQRQLICLARALLRKTKVLVLDEATAAVDLETDDLIQQTIRSEFKYCTVLTIAHRLNTIMDSDRVLVLDKGEVAEYEPPDDLLRRRTSIFYGMAKDAGLVS